MGLRRCGPCHPLAALWLVGLPGRAVFAALRDPEGGTGASLPRPIRRSDRTAASQDSWSWGAAAPPWWQG
ncbi:hypothetical protein NDU88_001662 [Pleurodeles waltl]|uniref:Uncharacterized protein n=1 Tax=Pleurodeles waltl TaxID=8319 RepID=A0AAV7NBS2_PLEWA|nr:hypothetical protein NDU88_001662 [Pleurodeles waltl]